MGTTELRNEIHKLKEKLAKTEGKLRKRKKFFLLFEILIPQLSSYMTNKNGEIQ